jgi:hypothetical protein
LQVAGLVLGIAVDWQAHGQTVDLSADEGCARREPGYVPAGSPVTLPRKA